MAKHERGVRTSILGLLVFSIFYSEIPGHRQNILLCVTMNLFCVTVNLCCVTLIMFRLTPNTVHTVVLHDRELIPYDHELVKYDHKCFLIDSDLVPRELEPGLVLLHAKAVLYFLITENKYLCQWLCYVCCCTERCFI